LLEEIEDVIMILKLPAGDSIYQLTTTTTTTTTLKGQPARIRNREVHRSDETRHLEMDWRWINGAWALN